MSHSEPKKHSWLRAMTGRSASEGHRPSTPLELFFDLCFVVAVSIAAARLHHSLAENEPGHGVLGYVLVFFGIWWAWMNFSWFGSSYDTDDVPYRVATLVQIVGVLILAAGIVPAFEHGDFAVITVGYAVMRLVMVAQWLRAAKQDPPRRKTALRYAVGITVLQLLWIARLWIPEPGVLSFAALAVLEVTVPIWAERATPTTWHAEHIAERYGLFTLIVLGESVLAATTGFQGALADGNSTVPLASLGLAGLVIVFSMWWLYFDQPAAGLLTSTKIAFVWGYGHVFIFMSAAATGAGLQVAADFDKHTTHISGHLAALSTAIPVAIYLLSVWLLQIRPQRRGAVVIAFPVAAALVLGAAWGPAPIHVIAGLLAVLVAVTVKGRVAQH